MADDTDEIETLIRKAAGAEKSEDAIRFSQAACNVANARRVRRESDPT